MAKYIYDKKGREVGKILDEEERPGCFSKILTTVVIIVIVLLIINGC